MLDFIIEPVQIDLPLDKPNSTRVLHVGCGRAHTVVVTDGDGGKNVSTYAVELYPSVAADTEQ